MEVRSFDRAIQALKFFEKHINPRAAKATKLRVVNRFFAASEPNVAELLESPYDRYFDGDEVVIPKLIEELQETKEVQESREEGEEFQKGRLQELEGELKKKFPEIEEISLEFYRDDSPVWSGLQLALTLRRIEARAHFAGRKNFSRYDLIEEMAQNFVEILKSEQPSQPQASEK